MRKPGGSNFTPIRSLAAVRDDVDAHLSLWGFDGRVRFPRGYGVALCVEQEVVDQGFHVLLHGGARRRGDFIVFDPDWSRGHLVEALVDDA